MDLIAFEHSTHLVVAVDLALVGWDLEAVGFDVLPDLLDCLWS